MTSEVVHDLDLPADVFNVIAVDEFAGGYRFAGELQLGFLVGNEIGDSKLATTQLAAECVCVADILHGTTEDSADGGICGGRAIGGL